MLQGEGCRGRDSTFDIDSNDAGEGIVLPDSYRAPLRPGGGAGVPGMVRFSHHLILSSPDSLIT